MQKSLFILPDALRRGGTSSLFRYHGSRGALIRSLHAAVVGCLLVAIPARPWGQNGHRVIGEIAARHLTAIAAEEVSTLLSGETLAEAGTWADEIRSEPRWRVADSWHYINVDDFESVENVLRQGKPNVVSEIERFTKGIRNSAASQQERAEALLFLTHLVADLHQPLHVGRNRDKGGNGTQVTWFRRPTNLHAVWDTSLIEFLGLSYTELAGGIENPPYRQRIEWQTTPVTVWAKESFALRSKVYEIGSGDLSFEYARASVPIVRQRLLQAGVRLAGLLNDTFY